MPLEEINICRGVYDSFGDAMSASTSDLREGVSACEDLAASLSLPSVGEVP